jgi:DNA-binding HxlR family transcriptional regulator
MKLPDKYSYLKLLDKTEQIIILELFAKKNIRTNKLYKMGIVKSYKTLYDLLDNLIKKSLIRKIEHNKSNITYELTPKGLNLGYILASNEKMFNSYVNAQKNFIIIVNIGHTIPDLLKRYVEYRLDVNGFQ